MSLITTQSGTTRIENAPLATLAERFGTPCYIYSRAALVAAFEAYRAEAGQRAARAKRAELDSLELSGWAFDSLAAGLGGLKRAREFSPGARLPGIATAGPVDTLLFGERGDDGLPVGRLSDWIRLPDALVRLRTAQLHPPDATALEARVQAERRGQTETALNAYFEGLKKRYPVRILDRQLRQTLLPQVQLAP